MKEVQSEDEDEDEDDRLGRLDDNMANDASR